MTRDGFASRGERLRLLGYAAYLRMVKPEQGERYDRALRAIEGGAS